MLRDHKVTVWHITKITTSKDRLCLVTSGHEPITVNDGPELQYSQKLYTNMSWLRIQLKAVRFGLDRSRTGSKISGKPRT
jgi:hypothetical protein